MAVTIHKLTVRLSIHGTLTLSVSARCARSISESGAAHRARISRVPHANAVRVQLARHNPTSPIRVTIPVKRMKQQELSVIAPESFQRLEHSIKNNTERDSMVLILVLLVARCSLKRLIGECLLVNVERQPLLKTE
jgi:ribosomal protein L28